MQGYLRRRHFVQLVGASTVVALGGLLQACQSAPAPTPPVGTSAPAAAAGQAAPAATSANSSLVVAVTSWATETSIPWRSTQGEKPLWEGMYDGLVWRDPQTHHLVPGLGTSWDHSHNHLTRAFQMRQGGRVHRNSGAVTYAAITNHHTH